MGCLISQSKRSTVYPNAHALPTPRPSTVSGITSMSSISDTDVEGATLDIRTNLCGADPITKQGKQIQTFQMLTFPMIPTIVLMVHCLVYLVSSLDLQWGLHKAKTSVATVVSLADVVQRLQEERLAMVLYSLKNDSVTQESDYPELEANNTDKVLQDLDPWPEGLTCVNMTNNWFRSRGATRGVLEETRDSVRRLRMRAEEVLDFYERMTQSLISVIDYLIANIDDEVIWRVLIGYAAMVKATDTLASFTALAEMRLGNQQRLPLRLRTRLFSSGIVAADYVHVSVRMSRLSSTRFPNLPRDLSSHNLKLNESYQLRNMSVAIQRGMADDIYATIYAEETYAKRGVTTGVVLLVTIVVVSVIVVFYVNQMVRGVHNYMSSLYRSSVKIRREKKKSDDLLYQMLPKSVALQLKVLKRTSTETFRSVTIFFSDIVGFTELSSRSTPLEVVDTLNGMYNLFDGVIEGFDAYKVETIGDAYMVASGVPSRNGLRHAAEIAKMSMELLEGLRTFDIPHKPDERLRIRIGIHTGPVVAGVVGYKMPRYCLFGDTVTFASLMESNGVPMKIQLSQATTDILAQLDTFQVESRGIITVKGYGETETFFLRGRKVDNRRR